MCSSVPNKMGAIIRIRKKMYWRNNVGRTLGDEGNMSRPVKWKRVRTRDTYLETGGPARRPAQVAGRKKYFVLGWLEQRRQHTNLLYRHDEPNKPTKEEPLSFVLHKSPFASVLKVSRGHPSLVSLGLTHLLCPSCTESSRWVSSDLLLPPPPPNSHPFPQSTLFSISCSFFPSLSFQNAHHPLLVPISSLTPPLPHIV